MKPLLLALLLSAGAFPQSPFTFYIHDTTGQLADAPLPAIYQLNSTVVGNGSPLVLKVINSSTNTVQLSTAYVSSDPNTPVYNSNFLLSGLYHGLALAPQGSAIFTVSFSPVAAGPITGYLQVSYQIQQLNCSFTNPSSPCPGGIVTASTLTGTATSPTLIFTYTDLSGTVVTPQAGASVSFGNVSTSANAALQFTLANQSAFTVANPPVSLSVQQFGTSAYQLNTTQSDGSAYPGFLAPNASATFVVTFAPGQTGLAATTQLNVGSNFYSLVGSGVVIADIDALQIAYVDSTGVRTLPQAATPISFGQLLAGAGATSTLNFTVTNPLTSYNAVNVANLTVTGAGFGIGSAPTIPASIAPGQQITFNLTFVPAGAGNFTGTLSIGPRQFALSGFSALSPLPALSLSVAPSTLTSQLQANATLSLAGAANFNALGTLTMTFTSAVANVTDDPAVLFTSTSGRNLSVNFATGSQTAVDSKGASPFTFQTGTTAGTIAFTANFVNTNPYTRSFDIPPAVPKITSSSALRQSPNLVVTVNGYDNTYSAGQLSFAFYDTGGNLIQPAIQYNAASQFHQYFFTNNAYGGSFAMQATFPDTGDVTKVGSVAVTVANTVGQTTTTQTFQ